MEEKMTNWVIVDELSVVRTKMQNAVSALQKKCEESICDGKDLTSLPTIDEGWIWDSEHRVTGSEINNLISEIQVIQSHAAKQRRLLWKNLIDVYKTIGGLDADYLSKIEKAFDHINFNYEKIKENTLEICHDQREIEKHRERIDQLIQGHELALQVLQQFKIRIDKLSHLEEMDQLLGKINIEKSFKEIDVNCQKLFEASKAQSDLLDGTKAEVKQLEERAEKAEETICGHEAEMLRLKKRINLCAAGITVAFIFSIVAAVVAVVR